MNKSQYLNLRTEIVTRGYAQDIEWSESIVECPDAVTFFQEFTWVVVNSGMHNQVARKIYGRIMRALIDDVDIATVFGHAGKVAAIQHVWTHQADLFFQYSVASDKLQFLETLPWIGQITKYHLAKNLGVDLCKPDRHLERIAKQYHTTPHTMCERLATVTGDRIATVDTVIWRAATLRLI